MYTCIVYKCTYITIIILLINVLILYYARYFIFEEYDARGTKFQNLFFEKHTKKTPQTHKDNYISIIFTDSLHYR